MLNKLYVYHLFNILKVNVPLPEFGVNHAPFPPSICPPPPHSEIFMDNPAKHREVAVNSKIKKKYQKIIVSRYILLILLDN